jgi:dTDP-4-amino-4,6-dideoxygalactose transaminase
VGKNLFAVEEMFKDKLGCKHAILVNNGTSALIASHLAVKKKYPELSSIGVPSFTFIASLFSAQLVFNEYRLLDCDTSSWNVNPQQIDVQTDLTLLVDVGGVPCDYDSFSNSNNLYIADSAESLGSLYKGTIVGTQLPIHTFSFQRSKIITSGEGGLIAVNDDELAEHIRGIINHGYAIDKKPNEYIHDRFGLNFRMCDVEAAILKVQLSKLDQYIQHRESISEYYRSNLSSDFVLQKVPSYARTNNFFFGMLVPPAKREMFVNYLTEKGIEVKCWKAIHQQPNMPHKSLPNASYISDSNVLLPIHNTLTVEEVEYIVKACNSF